MTYFRSHRDVESRNKLVARLYTNGRSYGWIGQELGITRSAVAGIVSRSGVPKRGMLGVRKQVQRVPPAPKVKTHTPTLKPIPAPEPRVERVPPPEEPLILRAPKPEPPPDPKTGAYTIIDLPPKGCKYATGQDFMDPRMTYRFCGRDIGSHHAYCPAHAKLVEGVKP